MRAVVVYKKVLHAGTERICIGAGTFVVDNGHSVVWPCSLGGGGGPMLSRYKETAFFFPQTPEEKKQPRPPSWWNVLGGPVMHALDFASFL